MQQHTIRVSDQLDQQIRKYAALKQQSISNVLRELIVQSLDVTANESDILKEIKSLRVEVRDSHDFNKKGFDRLASLSVKNGKKIFAIWHAILILIFFRGKDKGMTDNESLESRDQSLATATKMGITEFNSKG